MTKRSHTPVEVPRSAIYIAVSIITLAIVLMATVWRQPIVNQLNRWKLLPEPEKLTELYFTKPNNLPSMYTPGQAQKIDFTVHNLEYQKMTYNYAIVEESQDGSQSVVLTQNNFTLNQDQYQSVSFSGPLADMGPKAKVVIELPTVHESIDYLITSTQRSVQ